MQDRGGVVGMAVVAAWGAAVALGFALLLEYGSIPGDLGRAPAEWPTDSRLTRDLSKPTLVFVAHPRCSCTRASLAELSRLVTRLSDRIAVRIVVVQPAGVSSEFTDTDLRSHAARLAGVEPHVDRGGREATRFGAETSGTTLLYGSDGRLLFQGGITPRRGHQGESVGHRRILELVEAGRTDRDRSAVFGCRIRESAPAPGSRSILESLEFPDAEGREQDITDGCGAPAGGAGQDVGKSTVVDGGERHG